MKTVDIFLESMSVQKDSEKQYTNTNQAMKSHWLIFYLQYNNTMFYTLTEQDIETLKRVYKLLTPKMTINAVYTTPAQSLRNQANAIEEKEKLMMEFRDLLSKI